MPGSIQWAPRSPEYQSQKQCKKTSFAFYQAVRDLLPVWLLEDMRLMEVLHWEEGGIISSYTPSEALLYALVHDHQPYAHYLLNHFPNDALAVPSKSFSCCQSGAPHLTMAVRYNRLQILQEILCTLRKFPSESRTVYINQRGCQRVEGGKTPIHLACELQRVDCLILLLGHGACPYVKDCSGKFPLDCLLQAIQDSPQDMHLKRLCLDSVLLYMAAGVPLSTRQRLQEEGTAWQEMLGKDLYRWLTGTSAPTLFTLSMQSLLRALPADRFPEVLEEISLPDFLRPLALQKQVPK
ncbi:ankyrin repeat domain-containing protein 9 [Bufo gargarizans]|uniref:ankyrin repeat domain-containing protein 9 n=1 Tax=Bufo gargarizans TaxID=30331 RepID=UPI001CF1B3B4|nr:ankyrin repeat domain-containing protein 9 [Bufo gargarizans]XP_044127946.1 ankyrin repeat domain-containing protein 9 [Bufo gargarizans]XP_044127947.1 ankyrin repeat domain-containing protein 9 [Bufo gargarizans]